MSITISLTDFVEFVIKSGSPKLTLVKQIKNRKEYHPNKDYWKIFRDNVEEFHKNDNDKSILDSILDDVSDKAKLSNYSDLITAYKAFLGKKKIKWFEPPYKVWSNNNLAIRLNPELGLEIGNKRYIIKLYLKSESITKNRVDLILTLLKKELGVNADYQIALLDVKSKKLYTDEKIDVNILTPLLIGEASSFETIWNNI